MSRQTNKSIFIRYAIVHLSLAALMYFFGFFMVETVGHKPIGWTALLCSGFQVLCVICKPLHLAYRSSKS